MSSFSVKSGDGTLLAKWTPSHYGVNAYGDLIINNITKREYSTIHLSETDFTVGEKEFPVTNGDVNTVRLLTNGGFNYSQAGCVGKSVPDVLQIALETRNTALAIRLDNYNPLAAAVNGFDPITRFDVLIDADDDQDVLQQFTPNQIQNGRLVINSFNNAPLINGTTYEIVIRAVNSVGAGDFTQPLSHEPSEKPSVPSNFAAVVSNASVELSWTPGSEAYDYSYKISKKMSSSNVWEQPTELSKMVTTYTQGISSETQRTSYTYTNLINGTAYDFKLLVESAYGPSTETTVLNKVPFTVPGIMDDNKFVKTDLLTNSISVTLKPPNFNGGKAVTSYVFKIQGQDTNYANGLVPNQNGEVTFEVPNLVAGSPVQFHMYAKNSNADNSANVFSSSYVQYKTPSAVTNLVAVNDTAPLSEDGKVKLTWGLPSDMGGASSTMFHHLIKYHPYIEDANGNLVLGEETSYNAFSALEHTFSELEVGKPYSFRIQSKFSQNNVDFISVDSGTVSVTPNCAAAAPVPSVGMADNKVDMKITWGQPQLYGLELRKYQWKINNGPWYDELLREVIVTPSIYGQSHTVYLRTVTILPGFADLVSDDSSAVSYIPYKAPSAVRINGVTGFDVYSLESAVELRWEEPSDKGGYATIKYNIVVDGVLKQTVTSTRVNISILSNQVSYIAVIPVGYIGEEAKMSGPAVVKQGYAHNDPLPPSGLSLTPSDGQIRLDWVASDTAINDGGAEAPVISYIIFRDDVKLSDVEIINGAVSYTNTGLVNGRQYSYRVITKQTFPDNTKTFSDNFTTPSDLKSATPFKVPEPPQSLILTAGDRTIVSSWSAASSLNGLPGPAKYRVLLFDPNNVQIKDVETTSLTQTFGSSDGVVNGLVYTVKVYTKAENIEANVSGWYQSDTFISATVTPNVKPLAPVNVSAVAGDQKINLSWTAPSDNYSTQSYKILQNNNEIFETTELFHEISGLINGTTYSISIRRVTITGEQSDLVTNSIIPFGKPLFVSLSRINDNKQVRAVINPNGSALKDFIVFVAPQVYSAGNVLIHKDSPISPVQTQITGNVSRDATQLSLGSSIVGAYLVAVNDAGVLTYQTTTFN